MTLVIFILLSKNQIRIKVNIRDTFDQTNGTIRIKIQSKFKTLCINHQIQDVNA